MRSHIRRSSRLHPGPGSPALPLLLLLLPGWSLTPAARGETLRWKFKPGETLHYTMDQKSVMTAKLPGTADQKTTMSQTIEMAWSVKSVDAGGVAELTQTIIRIRDQIEGAVGSYTYDSKDGKEPESLIAAAKIPIFKALLGTQVPFKMTPRGEAGDVRVPDSLTKALNELGPAAADAAALLSEEGLKQIISRAGLLLPEEDVNAGKTWTQQTRLGALVLDQTYRLEGPAPAPDNSPGTTRITMTAKAELQPNEAEPNPSPAKIRSQKSQGTYTFDNNAGRILDSSLSESIEVASSFKLGQGASAKEVEIVQSSESTTVRKLVK